MSAQRWPHPARWRPTVGWRIFQVIAVVALLWAAWQLLSPIQYRVDLDVYRQGARQWLDGLPLYGDTRFKTWVPDDPLPFTYPPLAAILFTPFAWMSMSAASTAITVTTLVLLMVSTVVVLNVMNIGSTSSAMPDPGWLNRIFIAAGLVAAATMYLEPIKNNFNYGQINVVLMTMVILDCLLPRTPWPRGVLVGLAIAVKLTPAVFLLYFLAKRDRGAIVAALISFTSATALVCAIAPRESWQYWTQTLVHTNRIGDPSLNSNQNIAGILARAHVHGAPNFIVWFLGSVALLVLVWWVVRRTLLARQEPLALVCVALFGLLVSPVSWSHHWVWVVPAIIAMTIIGFRRRNLWLLLSSATGALLFWWRPWRVLKNDPGLAIQMVGGSYAFWAVAVLVIVGLTVPGRADGPNEDETSPQAEPHRAEPAQPAGA